MNTLISVIIPVYNEKDNIEKINEQIKQALSNKLYEVIYINDGSDDGSYEELKKINNSDEKIKIINFSKNYGQTAAIQAGIDYAEGEIIIPLDADLQNDPKDIEKMLEIYNQGFDVVSGWRKNRKDNFIRIIPTKIANFIISKTTRLNLHDFGCTLKIYNAKILKKVRLYGELHRFIPALVSTYTSKITEVPVSHHPRLFGKSKYNLSRTKKVIFDLLTVIFLLRYRDRPIQFFSSIAIKLLILAAIFLIAGVCLTKFFVLSVISFFIAISSVSVSIISILIGLASEIIMRTFYESCGRKIYHMENYDET